MENENQPITKNTILNLIRQLQANDSYGLEMPVKIYNKSEWLNLLKGMWTEEEIDNADKNGFIGTKYGVDCYVTSMVSNFIF